MRVTGYVNDREELYSRVKNGDIAIFGHFKDLDIWIPFEYDFQKSVKIIPKMTVEKSFGVEDTYFYERYVLAGNSDSGFCIELSDNLTVDLKHDKFIFEIKSDIEGVMRDINFLDAVCHGHRLISGEDNICEYSDPLFGSDMKQMVSDVKDFYAALKHFDFRITKSFSEFTNADFSAMNALIRLYRGEYRSNNTTEWYMWWWDGKVMPIFVAINPNNHRVHAENTVSGICAKINSLVIFPERNELDEDELLAGLGVRKDYYRNYKIYYVIEGDTYEGNTEELVKGMREVINADTLELTVKDEKPTKSMFRFVWGGMQVYMKKKPELEPYHVNLDEYDNIIIGTPC